MFNTYSRQSTNLPSLNDWPLVFHPSDQPHWPHRDSLSAPHLEQDKKKGLFLHPDERNSQVSIHYIYYSNLLKYLQAVCVVIVGKVHHPLLAICSRQLSPPVLTEPPQTLVPLLDTTRLQPVRVTLRSEEELMLYWK